MKTLVCIDGQENALKAVRLAGKFACTTSSEASFLLVQRHRTHSRTEKVPPQTMGISVDLWRQVPEMKYLLEAEGIFKEAREWDKKGAELGELHSAFVRVGDGVFEVGKVQLGSDTGAHLRSRLGVPQEEILLELEDGQYDLVMLGAHRIPGCPWSEIEHGPLYVAQRAQCPVMVIGKEFAEGQPVLVYVGEKDPAESTSELVKIIATRMKSDIEVLAVHRRADSSFQFSPKVSSMIDTWSVSSLKVTPKVVAGDPVTVVLEMAPNYGLTVCSPGVKHKKDRLGKVTKSVLCSHFNLLIAR
jgi:nucleotide-binding universal stress UspA family protein